MKCIGDFYKIVKRKGNISIIPKNKLQGGINMGTVLGEGKDKVTVLKRKVEDEREEMKRSTHDPKRFLRRD